MMYKFRKDSGEIIEVDYATMMLAKDGFLEIDGEWCRRVHEGGNIRKTLKEPSSSTPKTVSSAMGCPESSVADWREHARLGNHDVEFVPDPHEPTFYNAVFESEREREKYVRARGFFDKNPHSGKALSPLELEKARQRILEQYGEADGN